MEYTEKDLVKIAKRENNTKRNYLPRKDRTTGI